MTAKPKIELKNIQVHVGLSDETPAYTAKLFVDGKHFADVSNEGHGGCDNVYPPKGKFSAPGQLAAFTAELNAIETRVAATYPKHDMSQYKMEAMPESLECLCHTLVWEHVDLRNFKSKLSRKVLIRRDGTVYELKGKRSPQLIEAAVAKYGRDNVLNLMDVAEAFKLCP